MTEIEITIQCEFNKVKEIKSKLDSLPEIENCKIIQQDSVIPSILHKGTQGQIDLVEIVISVILSEALEQTYKYLKQKVILALKDNHTKIKSSKRSKRKKKK